MKSHDLDALKTGKGNVENPSYYGTGYICKRRPRGVEQGTNRALTEHENVANNICSAVGHKHLAQVEPYGGNPAQGTQPGQGSR